MREEVIIREKKLREEFIIREYERRVYNKRREGTVRMIAPGHTNFLDKSCRSICRFNPFSLGNAISHPLWLHLNGNSISV